MLVHVASSKYAGKLHQSCIARRCEPAMTSTQEPAKPNYRTYRKQNCNIKTKFKADDRRNRLNNAHCKHMSHAAQQKCSQSACQQHCYTLCLQPTIYSNQRFSHQRTLQMHKRQSKRFECVLLRQLRTWCL